MGPGKHQWRQSFWIGFLWFFPKGWNSLYEFGCPSARMFASNVMSKSFNRSLEEDFTSPAQSIVHLCVSVPFLYRKKSYIPWYKLIGCFCIGGTRDPFEKKKKKKTRFSLDWCSCGIWRNCFHTFPGPQSMSSYWKISSPGGILDIEHTPIWHDTNDFKLR